MSVHSYVTVRHSLEPQRKGTMVVKIIKITLNNYNYFIVSHLFFTFTKEALLLGIVTNRNKISSAKFLSVTGLCLILWFFFSSAQKFSKANGFLQNAKVVFQNILRINRVHFLTLKCISIDKLPKISFY